MFIQQWFLECFCCCLECLHSKLIYAPWYYCKPRPPKSSNLLPLQPFMSTTAHHPFHNKTISRSAKQKADGFCWSSSSVPSKQPQEVQYFAIIRRNSRYQFRPFFMNSLSLSIHIKQPTWQRGLSHLTKIYPLGWADIMQFHGPSFPWSLKNIGECSWFNSSGMYFKQTCGNPHTHKPQRICCSFDIHCKSRNLFWSRNRHVPC